MVGGGILGCALRFSVPTCRLLSITNLSCHNQTAGRSKVKNLPPMAIRRDPVALYHYYKSFWDRQKAPGENPRMRLRWNVRAGTLGRVPCDPVSLAY
jgi:hypothetical protein